VVSGPYLPILLSIWLSLAVVAVVLLVAVLVAYWTQVNL
jgi:CHASE3 domain sensor protein